MDCKITSTKSARGSRRRHWQRWSQAGVTLVELMVSIGLGALVLTALASLIFFSGRSFAALTNYVDLDTFSRNALDAMSKEIRQVDSLVVFTGTRLDFIDSDGQPLTYVYVPNARELRRIKADRSTVLLRECDYLQFSVFQRNPVGGTYDVYPTGTPATAKLIQLNWVCSREIFGARANTESVQSAKIVIRKQE